MNTNCHICDRPDCDVEAARVAYHGLAGDPTSTDWPTVESRWNDALRDCHRRRINWRGRALAAEAKIAACAAIEWADWMVPMLDGLAMVLVQAERTGRPVATRLMCRVSSDDRDDDPKKDIPMVSVWATTGDGNPIDRCAELSAKVLALGGEP